MALKILSKEIFLSIILIIFQLINIIFADNLTNIEFNSKNIIYLKVKGKNGIQQIINQNYISDCIAYYNGFKIDFDGYILMENNKINNVTLIWENKLDTSEELFMDIEGIIEIDLSKFDSSNITSMRKMFSGCTNLQYINFSNINTSSVTNMSYMFENCNSLSSLDLSYFDTSNVLEMEGMFLLCTSITSLNLSYFSTPYIQNMISMFEGCNSLKKIDLTNIETTFITSMKKLFYDCNKLTSLNLISFDVTWVTEFYMPCLNHLNL